MRIKQLQYTIQIQERSPPSLQSLGVIATTDSSSTMTLKIFTLPWGFDWRSRRDRDCISIQITFQFSFYFILCYHFWCDFSSNMWLSNTILLINFALTQEYVSKCDVLYNYPSNSSNWVTHLTTFNIWRCNHQERGGHKEEIQTSCTQSQGSNHRTSWTILHTLQYHWQSSWSYAYTQSKPSTIYANRKIYTWMVQ